MLADIAQVVNANNINVFLLQGAINGLTIESA